MRRDYKGPAIIYIVREDDELVLKVVEKLSPYIEKWDKVDSMEILTGATAYKVIDQIVLRVDGKSYLVTERGFELNKAYGEE